MCEDKVKRSKKGRPKRLQRRPTTRQLTQRQNQVYRELSVRTDILMKKSQDIHKKMLDLQDETKEFLESMKSADTFREDNSRFFGNVASVVHGLVELTSRSIGEYNIQ